jgi:uncharacterized protein YbjT (DUF2867 family)
MVHYTQVTVFGGTGFIGRYLIDQLADLGVIVRVATRSTASGYFLRTAGNVGQVVPVICNLHDDASVQKAIQGSDWVINLVGTLNDASGKNSFDKLHQEFPERLARIATAQNVKRFVHISALGASTQSDSHYAQSKAKGEQSILAYFPEATILRPSIVYGPEDRFFNFFAKMATISPVLPLIGGGTTKFQPVYVGDIVKAIIAALKQPTEKVQGKIFELGGDETYSFKELMETMFTYTGNPRRLMRIPFFIAKIQGAVFQHLPGSLLTVDQVKQLQKDNVMSGDLPGFKDLGITPDSLAAILPSYLKRFKGGRFAFKHVA